MKQNHAFLSFMKYDFWKMVYSETRQDRLHIETPNNIQFLCVYIALKVSLSYIFTDLRRNTNPATLKSTSTWSKSLARASTWSFLVTSTTLVLIPKKGRGKKAFQESEEHTKAWGEKHPWTKAICFQHNGIMWQTRAVWKGGLKKAH